MITIYIHWISSTPLNISGRISISGWEWSVEVVGLNGGRALVEVLHIALRIVRFLRCKRRLRAFLILLPFDPSPEHQPFAITRPRVWILVVVLPRFHALTAWAFPVARHDQRNGWWKRKRDNVCAWYIFLIYIYIYNISWGWIFGY